MKRRVFISRRFRGLHPTAAQAIVAKARQAGSKWTVLRKAAFLTACAAGGQPSAFLGFVSRREKTRPDLAGVKYKFAAAEALAWLTKVRCSSSLGGG